MCAKLVSSLTSTAHPIVTDEEKAIVNAIAKVLPNLRQLRCWNHIFRDVKRWLRQHGAPGLDISVYINDVRAMFHLSTESEYLTTLETMKGKWSVPFFDYYTNNINPDIHAIARWAIEEYGVYSSSSGITNNQSEAMNCVVKQLQNWHESPVDCMALSLYHLQNYYMMEIYRGQHGLGSYHVHPQLKGTATLPIPDFVVHSPGDIVEQIRGRLQGTTDSISSIEEKSSTPCRNLTQRQRACQLIQESKITYDSKLHTFTVLGSESRPYALKLFPKPVCSCASTTECYHLIAAKMYLGMEDMEEPKKFNLTQLRKNARKRKEKKSGRKVARVGDYEVYPAPDAITTNAAEGIAIII